MSQWIQLNLQDGFSPIIEEFHYFHDFTNIILLFILIFVGFIIVSMLRNKIIFKGLLEGQIIEFIWTLIPGLILIQIALPSLTLLYLIEDCNSPDLTIKAIGHQWYWEYEYSDFWINDKNFSFDSYIIPEVELELGIFRQLETDNRVVLPISTKVLTLVSRADVLHSWTVPSLGVKADAVPGRVNQLNFINTIPRILYGQCSEICGSQHSNMPISVEFVILEDFNMWIISNN